MMRTLAIVLQFTLDCSEYALKNLLFERFSHLFFKHSQGPILKKLIHELRFTNHVLTIILLLCACFSHVPREKYVWLYGIASSKEMI